MTSDPDTRLAALLHAAVEQIEPTSRLDEIRDRTRESPQPRQRTEPNQRPWALALVAAAAVAVVSGGVAVLGTVADDPPSPHAQPPTPPASVPQDPTTKAGTDAVALPIYYLLDTDRAGVRLVREFRQGDRNGNVMLEALNLLAGDPLDPDYRTAWPQGSFRGVGFDGIGDQGQIWVEVSDGVIARPTAMSSQEAHAGIEQVIRTLQGGYQTRAPVAFVVDGDTPTTTLLGVPVQEQNTPGPALKTLNHLNITSPEQGQDVTETLRFTGVANSFEASVYWEIRQGTTVRKSGPATAGWLEDRLYPFEEEIDVSDLEPGDYTIWATTGDPTAGTEGAGSMTDSKEFRIQ